MKWPGGFDHCDPAEHWRRRLKPGEMRTDVQAVLRSLNYLVFDGNRLVAAFAWLDDAQQWVEESGNPTMRVREVRPGKSIAPAVGRRSMTTR